MGIWGLRGRWSVGTLREAAVSLVVFCFVLSPLLEPSLDVGHQELAYTLGTGLG